MTSAYRSEISRLDASGVTWGTNFAGVHTCRPFCCRLGSVQAYPRRSSRHFGYDSAMLQHGCSASGDDCDVSMRTSSFNTVSLE